jgi:hypothetical protein
MSRTICMNAGPASRSRLRRHSGEPARRSGKSVRCPLEQEAAAKCARRLVERSADDTVEMEAADVHARRDLFAATAVLDALHEGVEQAAQPVPCDAHASIIARLRQPRLAAFAPLGAGGGCSREQP